MGVARFGGSLTLHYLDWFFLMVRREPHPPFFAPGLSCFLFGVVNLVSFWFFILMQYQPKRSRPAHPAPHERSNLPTVIFVTVCTKGRGDYLASTSVENALLAAWQKADAWTVNEYVLMPDHLHLVCTQGIFPPVSLINWTRYWKSLVSKELKRSESFWKNDYWDTQIRSFSHYEEKLSYIRQNPVRAGLVGRPEDWPFAANLHPVCWS
jgi:REP element-mobilizing transposase RayT